MRRRQNRSGRVAWAWCAVAWVPGLLWVLSGPALSQPEAPEADPWVDHMVAALRPGETLSADIYAWTKDETGSERNFEIEIIRRIRAGRLAAVVEMREERNPDPVVMKIESTDEGPLVSWSWDVRFQRFVRIAGLEGTEVFAGTHFRLEDLGFTDLRERKGGKAEWVEKGGVEYVRLTSNPYFYYGRVVTWMDRAKRLPTRSVIYDKTDARIRELRYEKVRKVGGYEIPTVLEFRDEMTRAETRLQFRNIRVGVPLRGEDFDLEELERRIQAGDEPVRVSGQAPDAA